MNLFECPRIDDAAGYVLAAMPDGEAESYRHHITQCVECASKVAELEFVGHALLSAVPQVTAPPEIRDRVMAVVRAEAELLQAAGAGADRPVRTEPRRFGWGFARLRPLTAGALATVLLAVGIGAGTILRGGESCDTRSGKADPSVGLNGTATLSMCGSTATVVVEHFDDLPYGRVIQLWYDYPNDGKPPRPGDLIAPRGGKGSADASGVKPGMDILMTVEPNGGSNVPTSDPVVKVSA